VKKKGKNQVVYNGPPPYLLDPNRSDLFADPRNVVQDKDGTNHLIGSGLSLTLQGHGPFQPSTTFQNANQSRTQTLHLSAERKPGSGLAEVEPYDYTILPIEKPSEHEARIGASKLGQAFPAKQNNSGSNFPSEAEISAPPANNIVGSQPSQNYPSQQYESHFSLKPGSVLDLQQSNILARRQNTSTSIAEHQSGQPNHNIVTLQTTKSSLPHRYAETTVQQLHPSQQSQAYLSRQNNPNNSSLFPDSGKPWDLDHNAVHRPSSQIVQPAKFGSIRNIPLSEVITQRDIHRSEFLARAQSDSIQNQVSHQNKNSALPQAGSSHLSSQDEIRSRGRDPSLREMNSANLEERNKVSQLNDDISLFNENYTSSSRANNSTPPTTPAIQESQEEGSSIVPGTTSRIPNQTNNPEMTHRGSSPRSRSRVESDSKTWEYAIRNEFRNPEDKSKAQEKDQDNGSAEDNYIVQEDGLMRYNLSKSNYDEFALPPYQLSASSGYSNIRSEAFPTGNRYPDAQVHKNAFYNANPRTKGRKRYRSVTPPDDYPVPDINDMSIPPELNTYTRAISGRRTRQTPTEYWDNRMDMLQASERRRMDRERHQELASALQARMERDEEEMYQGLQNFDGRRRGWTGEWGLDRQQNIQKYPESEHQKSRTQLEKERSTAEYSDPASNVRGAGLFEAMEEFESQREMDLICLEDAGMRIP